MTEPLVAGPIVDDLPPVLAEFPGGRLTRDDFRAALLVRLKDAAWPFDLADELYYQATLRALMREHRLPEPTDAALDAQFAEIERNAGGAESFARALAEVGRTPHDYRRLDMPAGFRVQSLATTVYGFTPPIRDDFLPRLMRDERVRRPLAWHGWDAPLRVATLDGRDYTADEMVAFAVRFVPDMLLRAVYDLALRDRVIAAEVVRRGVDGPAGLLPAAGDDAVARAYDAAKGDLAIVAAHWIYLPLPGEKERAELPAGVDAAFVVRAELTRLRAGLRARADADFDEVARNYVNRDRAGNGRHGFLGYLPGADWVARFVPPAAYRLDTLPDGRSPLALPPHPAVRDAARALAEGEISDLIDLGDGYALIKRGPGRAAPPLDAVRPALAVWLRAEAMAALLRERLKDATYLWTPEKR